ncbi:ABC-type polysaccharide/polyol phosphate export permease [Novosphingobium sp. PhB57]|uniref:ABC transporter permease n=1 Tax=Novosphingobium sp. PhB57 TaxID=2485107 RepID=UPI001044BAD3|nr:ABC transporter permease [Novosphingobium sp. PhB57]TCU59824.1 ABC-type polysaccharide/polyol phosphate export permease [Novosphingobium sp. PhB57]
MSNDDRIAKWRARREAERAAKATHGDLPTELALVAATAEPLVSGGDLESDTVLTFALDSLRRLPHETVGDRRQIYDAIARGIERGIEQIDPHPDYAELRRRQLRTIIRLLEADTRSGIDIYVAGFRPTGFTEGVTPLLTGYQRRKVRSDAEKISRARREALLADEAYTIAIPEDEEGDLMHLRDLMVRIDAARAPRSSHPMHMKMRAWIAVLRYQFALLRAESRLAIVWTMVGPAVLMGLISAGYFLSGISSVLNMDVATFAMTGATTWIMFRTVIFRSSMSFHAHRALLNIHPITPSMIGLMQGLVQMLAYAGAFVVLIGVGYLAGLFSLPHKPLAVAFWIVCMGIAAEAIGIIFGALAVVWHYFPRFAPAIERCMQIFSSVILVSEQLPDSYRPIALGSPLAHAMQLMRQAYFENYTSDDASPVYFFTGLAITILIAFMSQWIVRSRVVPA